MRTQTIMSANRMFGLSGVGSMSCLFPKTVCWHLAALIAIAFSALSPCCAFGKNANPGNVVKITGTVKKISSFPSPQKSSYPDCFYTILLESKTSNGEKLEYLVLLKCFEKYVLIPGNIVKPGEYLHIEAMPFDDLPESEQAIQRADEIERFDLECYIARKVTRNAVHEKKIFPDSNVNGRKKKTVAFVVPPPISPEIKRQIDSFMDIDKKRISKQLARREARGKIKLKYLPEVWKTKESLRTTQPNARHFVFWSGDSLIWAPANREISLPPPSSVKIDFDSRSAKDILIAFDRELKKRNVRLIFVSFPSAEETYYAHFSENISVEESFDVIRLKILKYLLDNGVEVIDMGAVIAQRFAEYPFFQDIIRNDPHPMSPAIEVLADELMKRLKIYDWSLYRVSSDSFKTDFVDNTFKSVYPPGNGRFHGVYQVKCYRHKLPKGLKSPLIILGDSFSITPWANGAAGIGSCLVHRMCIPITGYSVLAGGGQLARTMSARQYLPISGHQVVIMVISGINGRWAPLVSDKGEKLFELSKLDGIPRNWSGIVRNGDSFSVKLTAKQDKKMVSVPYELVLDVGKRLGAKLAVVVKTCNRRMGFSLLDDKNKKIADSVATGWDNDEDSLVIDLPTGYSIGNGLVKIQFYHYSSKADDDVIKIKDVIVSVD